MSDEAHPEELFSEGALKAAERFFMAIAASDARAMWELFSEGAQAYVLNIAVEHGMNFDQASRIRQGTASDEEMDGYVNSLLEGVRRDLRGVDLDRLAFSAAAEPEAPMQVRVTYLLQLDAMIGDAPSALPAGSLVLALEDDEWKVERLVPKPG